MPTLSPAVHNLLNNNHTYTKNFGPPPTIAEYATSLAAKPDTPRICIIACCDPRVVPESIFGLAMGEAIVMRTAGGSVQPALAGLLAIDSLAPLTDLIVMRHTDCGTGNWKDDEVKKVLKERAAGAEIMGRRGERVDSMDFCESTGDEGDERLLREDVEWLRTSPLVRPETKRRVVGMLYVTGTGEVKVVC